MKMRAKRTICEHVNDETHEKDDGTKNGAHRAVEVKASPQAPGGFVRNDAVEEEVVVSDGEENKERVSWADTLKILEDKVPRRPRTRQVCDNPKSPSSSDLNVGN